MDKPSISEMIARLEAVEESDELLHYGTPRHSGRYPWGSGDNPYQRTKTFMARYRELSDKGLSDAEIAAEMKIIGKNGKPSATKVKTLYSIGINQEKHELVVRVQRMHEKGYSNVKIGEIIGQPESSVRNYLKDDKIDKLEKTKVTADMLRKQLKKKKYLDVGTGVNLELGVSESNLDRALVMLEQEGYTVTTIKVPQATNPNKKTTVRVLGQKGTTWGEINWNQGEIQSINEYSPNGGKDFKAWEYPAELSSKRVMVRYAEDGGIKKDGTIELRRGVDDISLGDSNYAQVRINVDGTHYLKGMAHYSDDMPEGVDVIFNTNKTKDVPALGSDKNNTVLKKLKSDPENPFGATLSVRGQSYYVGEDGKEHLRVINKLKEEGDWDDYSKTIASQMLSKQTWGLVKKQLNLTYADKMAEYDEIMSLENKVLKKKLLEEFAGKCDSDAEKLKASPFPGQQSKVLLPINSLKENECYAPTYPNGTKVVLIRYPHGGTFEIPTLTVNNKNKDGQAIIGNGIDAIGITSTTAERLSGADFDGDSVVVIPLSDKVNIKTQKELEGLKGFDPKTAYPGYAGMKEMKNTQTEMGVVSNLITDMTIKGAPPEDLAKAVRHSMVVIDAEKHFLDYQQSYKDNEIAALKKKYQDGGGASTLISRAKNEVFVNERKYSYKPDPETGKLTYKETGRTYVDKNGKTVIAQEKMTQMSLHDDARELSSGTPIEESYADYANKLKALANKSRKESMTIVYDKKDKAAEEKYAAEVASLKAKLNLALKNAPKERMAQIKANQEYILKKAEREADGSELKSDDKKKIRDQAITKARIAVGSDKQSVLIDITDKEWEAIQNNAVNPTTLSAIFDNADDEKLKQRAMPKDWDNKLSDARVSRIKAMSNSGYTIAQIAEQMNISTSTVSKYIKE